jgi:predicted house-cleaning noncanonical NTP pyrophosphatase (MazG superfamily)
MKYGKLVRDRIPEIIRSAGGSPTVSALGGEELLNALFAKLLEEATELRNANGENRVEELADVFEVILAIADNFDIEISDVERAAATKRAARGGFRSGLFLHADSGGPNAATSEPA